MTDSLELSPLIDALPVPAFLIEVGADDRFRIGKLNEAHESLTGMSDHASRGMTIEELLGDADVARVVDGNYARCVDGHGAEEYDEELVFGDRKIAFQTKLKLHSNRETGGHTIVGVAMPLRPAPQKDHDDLMYDVSILRSNLGRLGNALEVISSRENVSPEELMAVSTVARMTQQSASDLTSKLSENHRLKTGLELPGILKSLHATTGL